MGEGGRPHRLHCRQLRHWSAKVHVRISAAYAGASVAAPFHSLHVGVEGQGAVGAVGDGGRGSTEHGEERIAVWLRTVRWGADEGRAVQVLPATHRWRVGNLPAPGRGARAITSGWPVPLTNPVWERNDAAPPSEPGGGP